jgi:DNA polymerase-3 subunit gamma/tau
VKFIFATTEIEKVPVTVRSRCQRFDLRRVEAQVVTSYLASICGKEGVAAERPALALIARAAEGSVRDALSLLDHAIAHGSAAPGAVTVESVRSMLGLADRAQIIDLFEALMRGKMAQSLGLLKDLYDLGADPAEILSALAEFVHLVTRIKLVPGAAQDTALTPEESARGEEYAKALSIPVLTRAWQILLKGIREVRDSSRPLAAADMVLVRIGFAADLPAPDEILRELAPGATSKTGQPAQLNERAPAPDPARPEGGPQPQARSPAALLRFEDVVGLAARHRDIQLKLALERDVNLIHFEDGRIEFSLSPGASPGLAQTLMNRLYEWTGRRWSVEISSGPGAPSLKEQEEARAREALRGVRSEPLVQRALAAFPGAEIIAIRPGAQLQRLASAERGSDETGLSGEIDEDP